MTKDYFNTIYDKYWERNQNYMGLQDMKNI